MATPRASSIDEGTSPFSQHREWFLQWGERLRLLPCSDEEIVETVARWMVETPEGRELLRWLVRRTPQQQEFDFGDRLDSTGPPVRYV